jgi:NAD(P)-dependent dehydrogenase (short-subunit alcohol dehydrogenase family)
MADPFDLTDKIALITGGGRGLGREMAHAFAEHGADVIIASRKLDVLEQTATEIAAATGRTITPKACHVGDWDALGVLADEVYAEFGRVDVLVNNAGMSPLYESPSAVTEDLWRKVIDVNLTGPWRLSALVGERMKAAGGGTIINVSSTASVTPSAAELPYGAAKAGINNLTAGLAQTFGPEVRVNCLMPGPFATDISKAWPAGVFEHFKRAIPLQRAGEPHEVIGAALLLASDAGAYITGSIIRLDGGMTGIAGHG